MGAVPPPGVDINQGGVLKKSRTQKINFVSGATVVDNGDSADVTVTGGGGAGSGVNTLDQGVAVDTPATAINFAGGGVKTTGGAGTSTVTIPGSQFGTAAARPAAAASNRGEFYFSTDTGIMAVSDGSAWTAVVPSLAAGGTGQTTQQAAIDALTGTQSLAKYLRSDGTHATLSALAAADLTGTKAGVDSSAVHSGDAAGGDLTGTYPNPTVGTNAVTNAKAAQMAANTIKGNNTGGAANAADLTAAQVKALLAIATGDVSGLGTLATINSPLPLVNGGTGTAAASAAAAFDALAPTTTRGDIIARGASSNGRLAVGSSWQELATDGTDVLWKPRSRVLFSALNQGAVASITSGASLIGGYQTALSLNELVAGDLLRFRVGVQFFNQNGGATSSTMSVQVMYKCGVSTAVLVQTFSLAVASAATSTRHVFADVVLVARTVNSGGLTVFDGSALTHSSAANTVVFVLANGQAEYLTAVGGGTAGNNGPYLFDLQVNSTLNDVGCTAKCIAFSVEKVSA